MCDVVADLVKLLERLPEPRFMVGGKEGLRQADALMTLETSVKKRRWIPESMVN